MSIMPDPMCGRCQASVPKPEQCWYCGAPLCGECWEAHGHCGHWMAAVENAFGRGEVTLDELNEARMARATRNAEVRARQP